MICFGFRQSKGLKAVHNSNDSASFFYGIVLQYCGKSLLNVVQNISIVFKGVQNDSLIL